ncbi:hypothetical protein SOPP22_02655 [Shewanella sp. OPT22]|nr:hypothetical protein SOPP22_02655 [Shewanella sp. OPT22]
MKRLAVGFFLIATLTGCATNSLFVSYPSQLNKQRQALTTTQPLSSIQSVSDNTSGNDGLLYALEAGRIAQVAGEFGQSEKFYQQAVKDYQAFDDKATISLSSVGANASSLLLNDNAIPYRGPGYERVLLRQYQALNYLFQNDYQGALVEVRRANELQQTEQDKYAKSKKSARLLENGAVSEEEKRLSSNAGAVTSSYLNAYSFFMTGLLHEMLNQPNDAFIDYRKAAQIWPGNPYLEQSLVRLAKQLSMPQYAEFKKRWGDAKLPKKNQGELIIVYEKGFVQEKQSFTIPFRINGSWQTASLATYNRPAANLSPATVNINSTEAIQASPITNIDALAINALKEELPYALARQAARIAVKAELARKATSKHKRRNDELDIGSIAAQIFNVITEQADRRSWLTLPNQAQIARVNLNSGSYPLSIDNSTPHSINVEAGRKTLVWAIKTGNVTRFYSIII